MKVNFMFLCVNLKFTFWYKEVVEETKDVRVSLFYGILWATKDENPHYFG